MLNPTEAHDMCENKKSSTRIRVLRTRHAIGDQAREWADTALCHTLGSRVKSHIDSIKSTSLSTTPVIAGYIPMLGEPGGARLAETLAASASPHELILPVLGKDNDINWAKYEGRNRLRKTTRGLQEPIGPLLGIEAIAMASFIVAPAVAVDRRGVRLGRGGGSYDRALARVREGIDIVVPLYDGEFVDRLPQEPHDRRVSAALVAQHHTVTAEHWHSMIGSANTMMTDETETIMPTYQYVCMTCGQHLEAVQSFSDDPLTDCPACEGQLRKLFSAVGIVFKGSGFYRTDSRQGSRTSSAATSTSDHSSPSKDSASTSSSTKSSTDTSSASPTPAAAGATT